MRLLNSFLCLLVLFTSVMAVKKMIHPSVRVCKRDVHISECFKENLVTLLPMMRNGIPEMNIVPIEPVHVEHVRMDFPQTQSVKLTADMKDMKVSGMSNAMVNEVTVTPNADTLNMYLDLTIPKISLVSDYRAIGRFLVLSIDAQGNFTGDFHDLRVKINWTSTIITKKERQHLLWKNEIKELTINKMNIQFNNLFGNNTELTANTNNVINENIDALYDEISPVVKETINSVASNTVNNVYGLFPLDVLFPK